MDDILLENWLRFRRWYGTRDAVGMLSTILERKMDIDEEWYVWLIDWQKAIDCVNNQITAHPKRNWYWLEGLDIDQQTEMDQSVKHDWAKDMKDVWRLEDELEQDAVCYRFCSTYRASNLNLMLLKISETSKQQDK